MLRLAVPLLLALYSTLCGAAGAELTAADRCVFPETNMFLETEQIEACLKSIPYNPSVAFQTITNILDYMEQNVFHEVLMDPPTEFASLRGNVISCLQPIKERVMANGYPNEYEFHQEISEVFLPLKDPHTMYSKPVCFQRFFFFLPFTFESAVDDAGTQYLRTAHMPSEYRHFEASYWASDTTKDSPEGFYGYRVVAIDGHRSPVTWLADWADEFVYASKFRDSRFNQALEGDFWMRTGRYYGIPRDKVSVTIKRDDDVMEHTVTFRWAGINRRPIYSEQDFLANCPIRDIEWSEEARSMGGLSEPVAVELTKAEPVPPRRRFAMEMRETLHRTGPLSATGTKLERLLVSTDVSFYRYIPDDNDKRIIVLVNIPSFSPDDVPGFADALLEGLDIAKGIGMTHLVVNVLSNGGGWVTLGYRTLHTIAPHVFPLYGEYNIRVNGISDLLLDSALSQSTQEHIRPDTHAPFDGSEWYLRPVVDTYKYHEGCSAADGPGIGGDYKWDYSQRYFFEVAYDEHDFVDAFRRMDEYAGINLPPQNIAIVTDGLCGSTCSCFAKRAQEAHAAILVGMGGVVDGPVSDWDVSSFPGGSVSDSEYMEMYLGPGDHSIADHVPFPMPRNSFVRFAFEQVFSWNKSVTAPLEFHTNPVDLRVAHWPRAGGMWTEDLGTLVSRTVEDVFDVLSGPDAGYPPTSTQCLPWMVVPDATCTPEVVVNGQGGRPCKEGGMGYDMSKCALWRCDDGYYHDIATGNCLKRPVGPVPEKEGLSGGAIAGITIACVLVVGIIVVACLIYFGVIPIGKREKTGVEKGTLLSPNPEDGVDSSDMTPTQSHN